MPCGSVSVFSSGLAGRAHYRRVQPIRQAEPIHKSTFRASSLSGKIVVMKDTNGNPSEVGTPFDRFRSLLGKLMKVPKKEVDRKEAAHQRKRAKKRGEN